MPVPFLISMPTGLNVGGVTTFAVRLVNGLAAAGRHATILLHPEPPGCSPLAIEFHPRVEVLRPAMPRLTEAHGDLSPFIPHYLGAIRRLAAQSGGPVAFAPQMNADGYGIAAAISMTDPAAVRILGWQHSDIEYDSRVLAHYEPVISRFVAVSDRVEATLKQRLPRRAADIANIACGVEPWHGLPAHVHSDLPAPSVPCRVSPAHTPSNPPHPAWAGSPCHAIRLIYTGRIEHEQKRILALAYLSEELSRRGIPHQITAVGDGPAMRAFDAAIATRPHIRRLPPQSPARIAQLLTEHDAFILPSRYEGLSVSMLEAMAAGCTPILAQTNSGARQAVEPGYNGEIADIAPEADEPATALALADTIARHLARDPEARAAMSKAAQQTIADRFCIDRHVTTVATLIDAAANSPPRSWPADRPCAFTASPSRGIAVSPVPGSSSGSVPADGPNRLRTLLESLAGRSIIIHGTGQHTLQLGAIFASSPARILAFTDDDRQRHGQSLWNWPILAADDGAKTGATDVVISSWMHQEVIWARREVYESQGLRAHRIYP